MSIVLLEQLLRYNDNLVCIVFRIYNYNKSKVNFEIQSGPLIVNPQGTMLSCSYYKDFILSRLASVLLL